MVLLLHQKKYNIVPARRRKSQPQAGSPLHERQNMKKPTSPHIKKWLSILLTLLLCSNLAAATAQSAAENIVEAEQNSADTAWLEFDLTEGMQCYQSNSTDTPVPPVGMEEVYRWMTMDGATDESLLLTLPAGRGLINISRTAISMPMTAQELCAIWPSIADSMEQQSLYVHKDPACASVTRWKDRDWMHIQTTMVLDGVQMLSVDLTGYSLCDNGMLLEIWLAFPAATAYLYDETASAERLSDLEAAESWLESLSFSWNDDEEDQTGEPAPADKTNETNETGGEPPSDQFLYYFAPQAQFTLSMPENTLIILPEEIAAKRETAAQDVSNPDHLPLYMLWLDEAEATGATLFTDPSYTVSMLVIFSPSDGMKSLADIERHVFVMASDLSEPLTNSITQPPTRILLAGEESVFFSSLGTFDGKTVMKCFCLSISGDTLREVRLWFRDSTENVAWQDAMLSMTNSLQYHQPAADTP